MRRSSIKRAGVRGAAAGTLVAAALACALLVATLAGCGGSNGNGSNGGTQPAVYTEADSGKTVEAAIGDVLTIRLVENPSTGYLWQMELSAGLEQRSDTFIQPSASPGLVGAPGTHEFTVAATAAGTQTIKATYSRPWEDKSEGEKTFSLTVEVK